jgi:hypothetical protein
MSSGRVQLAAVGIQDQFLTGNPDVTYFIKKFNRHTKFALEVLNTTFFQTTIDFGSWVNVIVPRNGQLIRTLYVRLVLPPLTVGGYTNSIGNAIIEHADLVIGGQTIERINGEYMQIYDQSFISGSQQEALTYMVGSTDRGLYGLGPAAEFGSGATNLPYGWYPRTFIVPLPFYFFRNEALAIPLCALTRQEVEIRIKFRPLDQLIAGGYNSSNVITSDSINWITPVSAPGSVVDQPLSTVTWLPYSYLFACIPQTSSSNVYYYDIPGQTFYNLSNLLPLNLGTIQCIAQNNSGGTMILTKDNTTSGGTNNVAFSQFGPTGAFVSIPSQPVYNFLHVASDGTNFLAIMRDLGLLYNLVSFKSPSFQLNLEYATVNTYVSITWSPALDAYLIGDSSGVMHTYRLGDGYVKQVIGVTGPYSAYSPAYGQIYNNSNVVCSNTVISNVYSSSFDGGVTYTQSVPVNTTSIAYGSAIDTFFILQPSASTYSYGTSNNISTPTFPEPVAGYQFQASLPVEYVFLADEEVQYIQNAKIDYVITQLQMASVVIPAGDTELVGYRTYFINPTKEMFITIQDSNVLATNDYYNYFNTSQPTFTNYLSVITGTEQLVNLELQFNGENIISPAIADNLYLGKVQFLNNHTRLPNMPIYNYSFAIDPENYLPTGQVNLSRIMNQNFWINFTPNTNSRNVNIYTKSFNILRVQNGLAGVLFMDNNFIK